MQCDRVNPRRYVEGRNFGTEPEIDVSDCMGSGALRKTIERGGKEENWTIVVSVRRQRKSKSTSGIKAFAFL